MWTTTYPINLILSNESRFVKCFCLVFFVATIEVGFVDDTQLKRGFHESKSKEPKEAKETKVKEKKQGKDKEKEKNGKDKEKPSKASKDEEKEKDENATKK